MAVAKQLEQFGALGACNHVPCDGTPVHADQITCQYSVSLITVAVLTLRCCISKG